MNEYGMDYAGWEIIWNGEPEYIAAGFHSDGTSQPHAIAGDEPNMLVREVASFSGGWVLWERVSDDVPPEYEVIDGSEYVTEYGG